MNEKATKLPRTACRRRKLTSKQIVAGSICIAAGAYIVMLLCQAASKGFLHLERQSPSAISSTPN